MRDQHSFTPIRYDESVVIAGAGPAGSTASMVLTDKGINHLLIDKAEFPRDKVCGDALSGKVMSVLNRIRPELAGSINKSAENFLGSHGVRFVAPNGKIIDIPFASGGVQQAPPGFVSPRLTFDNLLYRNTESPQSHRVSGVTIHGAARQEEFILLSCSRGDENFGIRTRLVIGAEGERSVVARDLASFKKQPENYCAGVRAYYEGVTGMHEQNFIELHFLKEALPGYFWIFPMPQDRANVGLGMLSSKVSKNKVNLKKLFHHTIDNHESFRSRFANASRISPLQGWGLPLGNQKRKLSGDGYMLTGDAASLIDPFTGEGISNAMISGVKAGEMAAKCVEESNYSASLLLTYDESVYKRLWSELNLSSKMQKMVNYPWIFNFIADRAQKNTTLKETLMCMFDDIELRSRLTSPSFYAKLLAG